LVVGAASEEEAEEVWAVAAVVFEAPVELSLEQEATPKIATAANPAAATAFR
jgi:hypothetical protein